MIPGLNPSDPLRCLREYCDEDLITERRDILASLERSAKTRAAVCVKLRMALDQIPRLSAQVEDVLREAYALTVVLENAP